MNLLKTVLVVVGITSVLLSCSGAKVISTKKIEVNPGVINSELYYRFIIRIETKKETVFKSIAIDSITIQKFVVIDEFTKLQSDSKKSYPKGNYFLQFELPNEKVLKNNKELISLRFEQKEKEKLLKTYVDSINILKLR